MDFISKKIIKELSEKYDISYERMLELQESPYHFLKYVMTDEVDREKYIYPSVRIMGLGIFHCPDYVKEKFKRQNEDGGK